MRRLLYWCVATLLLAVVVHLFVVIFVPGVDTGQKLAQMEAAGEVNKLHQIAAKDTHQVLLTEPSPDLRYAFCKFDIRTRPLMIEGSVPPGYWSVSVYGETGSNVYTLNDRQAGVQKLQLMIVTEDEPFDDEARPENTIIVRVPTASGLVLFRALVSDRSQEELVESHLAASKCGLRPVQQAAG